MFNSRSDREESSFLGTGWSFPPAFDRTGKGMGGVRMTVAEEDILQSLQLILSTRPGERAMRPEFGCALDRYLFEVMEQGVLTSIQAEVSDALIYHEPRIEVNRLTVSPSATEPGLLLIEIEYTVRQTNARSNAVYPFYLNEATALD